MKVDVTVTLESMASGSVGKAAVVAELEKMLVGTMLFIEGAEYEVLQVSGSED